MDALFYRHIPRMDPADEIQCRLMVDATLWTRVAPRRQPTFPASSMKHRRRGSTVRWSSTKGAMRSNRERRIEDFKRRAAASPEAVHIHRTRGWSYIPVHDFADGATTQFHNVDCWCLLGEDAALLECEAFGSRVPGLYARVDAQIP